MINTPIHATDEIVISCPATEVWQALTDFAGYSQWWPSSLGIRLLSSGKEPLGAEIELHPLGGRSFRCRVEEVNMPERIQMRYFGEFVNGIGEWRLESLGQKTRVIYRLEVEVHGWLVMLIGKVLDLAKIHSRLMQAVLQNLSAALDRTQHPEKKDQ